MRHRSTGVAVAALALLCAAPAHADNYVVRDGVGALQTFASRLIAGVHYPIHLLAGMFAGSPTPISVDGSGNVNVNVVSGGGGSVPTGSAGSPNSAVLTVQGIAGATPQPVVRNSASYTESTVAVTSGTWTAAVAANSSRVKLILGDATGLGCSFSLASGTPASGEGMPFSLAGTPGSYPLDDPTPTNNVQVKCASSGTITVLTQ